MTHSVARVPEIATPARRKSSRRCFQMTADWAFYSRMLKLFEGRPGYRLAYDRGRLEIMSPSFRHDRADRFLGSLIPILARAYGLPMVPGGTVTLRRKRKQKGIEGDEVFWLANAPKVFAATTLKLSIHPPPDLAIEVDVSRSSLNRLSLYAAMGVPEVWRLENEALMFYGLSQGPKLQPIAASMSFPAVTPGDLEGFLSKARCSDHIAVLNEFEEWILAKLGQ